MMEKIVESERGNFTLRAAVRDDLDAFRELRLEALRDYPSFFGSEYETNKIQPEEFWVGRMYLDNDDGKVFVAEVDGQLAGMCGIMLGTSPKTRHNGTIWGVYVRRGWQGQHIARELIELCANWGREHGVRQLKLAVQAGNTSAIRCYTSCGFSMYGIDPQAICFEGKYYDELLMSLRL